MRWDRVRITKWTHARRLYDARFTRWTRAYRRPLSRVRLYENLHFLSRRFWRLPLSPRWNLNDGSVISQSFLSRVQRFLLDLRFLVILEYDGESPFN